MPEENYIAGSDIAELEEEEEESSFTYRLDLKAGRIVGYVDELEAVKQAASKALKTPRFKCLLYDDQYGSEIEDAVISKDASQEYIKAAVSGFLEDALLPVDSRILKISDIQLSFERDVLRISFVMETIFGETTMEETIQNV